MMTGTTLQAAEHAAMGNSHRPAFSRLWVWARLVVTAVAALPERNPGRSERIPSDFLSS